VRIILFKLGLRGRGEGGGGLPARTLRGSSQNGCK